MRMRLGRLRLVLAEATLNIDRSGQPPEPQTPEECAQELVGMLPPEVDVLSDTGNSITMTMDQNAVRTALGLPPARGKVRWDYLIRQKQGEPDEPGELEITETPEGYEALRSMVDDLVGGTLEEVGYVQEPYDLVDDAYVRGNFFATCYLGTVTDFDGPPLLHFIVDFQEKW